MSALTTNDSYSITGCVVPATSLIEHLLGKADHLTRPLLEYGVTTFGGTKKLSAIPQSVDAVLSTLKKLIGEETAFTYTLTISNTKKQ